MQTLGAGVGRRLRAPEGASGRALVAHTEHCFVCLPAAACESCQSAICHAGLQSVKASFGCLSATECQVGRAALTSCKQPYAGWFLRDFKRAFASGSAPLRAPAGKRAGRAQPFGKQGTRQRARRADTRC